MMRDEERDVAPELEDVATPETDVAAAAEPAVEPMAANEEEAEPEEALDAAADVAEPEAADEVEVEPEPEAAADEAEPDAAAEAEAEPEIEAEPEAADEAEPDAAAVEAEAEVEPDVEPEAADEPEPEAEPDAAADEAESEAELKSADEGEPDAAADEAEAGPEAEPEVADEAEAEPEAAADDAEPEAVAAEDAEPEADITAEAEPEPAVIATPQLDLLEAELKKEKHRSNYLRALRSTIFSLVVVAAAAVIVAMLVLPVLQIQGTSMTETLQDKDIVVALRGSNYETGDVIAFYYNNNILIKRVIASTGQWVDISEDGTVYVDNVRLDEPYVSEKSLGDCNITLPYQVPEGKIFVMGDHRSTSLDSRNTALGCISEDMVVGRLLIRAWPLTGFGPIH